MKIRHLAAFKLICNLLLQLYQPGPDTVQKRDPCRQPERWREGNMRR